MSSSNTGSSQQQAPRLTPRQASAQAQRKAMNERRQMLTQRIRKQKKSDWLAQKRGMTSTNNNSNNTTIAIDLSQSIATFCHQAPSVQTLQQLRTALQSASLASTPWTLEEPTKLEQATKLVQRLGESLQHFVTTNDMSGTLATIQVLLQVITLSANSSLEYHHNNNSSDYYGRRPTTWSELLAEESRIASCLPSLITIPPQSAATTTMISEEHLQVMEQTCWFIGNWTQDFPSCSIRLQQHQQQGNLVHHLIMLLTLIQKDPQISTNLSYVVVIQAAAFALVNLLKGDTLSSGWVFLQAGWNSGLASQLLTISVPIIQSSSQQLEKSCIDISVQSAWILVLLSQREDAVMDAMLQTEGTDLIRNVLERLYQVCEGAQKQESAGVGGAGPLSPGLPYYFHHPLLEPCLEVLGHMANVCNGKYVRRLLSPTPATHRVPQELSLIPILEKMLQWGQQGLLQVSDYLQLLWLCGCLLCDAGTQNHPSTSAAAPALVPLLTIGLQENALSNRANSLECKREGVLALWNALNTPPPSDEIGQRQQGRQHLASQETLLAMIHLVLNAKTPVDRNQAQSKSAYNAILALKKLLLCPDIDAMVASLKIINAILRNIPATRVTFMEVDGEEALETVCDLPLGCDTASNEAADMAAELIDDFFDSDRNDDGQFADPVLQPATAGGTFVFGLQNTAPAPAPIFLPDLQADGITGGSFLAPVNSVGVDPVSPGGMGRGRGRGRGHTLPAWAAAVQQTHR